MSIASEYGVGVAFTLSLRKAPLRQMKTRRADDLRRRPPRAGHCRSLRCTAGRRTEQRLVECLLRALAALGLFIGKPL